MTDKEKIYLYEQFIISLHTAKWTGNGKRFVDLLMNAQRFSYSRTNSTGDDEHDQHMMKTSLERLLDRSSEEIEDERDRKARYAIWSESKIKKE
jgi:hypothetical protein